MALSEFSYEPRTTYILTRADHESFDVLEPGQKQAATVDSLELRTDGNGTLVSVPEISPAGTYFLSSPADSRQVSVY